MIVFTQDDAKRYQSWQTYLEAIPPRWKDKNLSSLQFLEHILSAFANKLKYLLLTAGKPHLKVPSSTEVFCEELEKGSVLWEKLLEKTPLTFNDVLHYHLLPFNIATGALKAKASA